MTFLAWLLALMIGATLLALAGARATAEVARQRWRAGSKHRGRQEPMQEAAQSYH